MDKKSEAARAKHNAIIAVSRARLKRGQQRAIINQQHGLEKALQKAALRFLPAGTQLAVPRQLDLQRWPSVPVKRAIPDDIWRAVIKADPICRWCDTAPSTTVDHVHPLGRGGSNDTANLVGACNRCNSIKSNFMVEELGWTIHPRTQKEASHGT